MISGRQLIWTRRIGETVYWKTETARPIQQRLYKKRKNHGANTSDSRVAVPRIRTLFVLLAVTHAIQRCRPECFRSFYHPASLQTPEPETIAFLVFVWAFPPRRYSFRSDRIVAPIGGFFPSPLGWLGLLERVFWRLHSVAFYLSQIRVNRIPLRLENNARAMPNIDMGDY